MVINLTASKSVMYYETLDQLPGGIDDKLYKTDCLLMRKLHAAGQSFNKGIAYADKDVYNGWYHPWNPSHRVSFTNDYYLAIYKTTVRQMFLGAGWKVSEAQLAMMNEPTDECPYPKSDYLSLRGTPTADHYDWPRHGHEVLAESAIGKFRALTGVELDCPTDAQWEFACRAGEDRLRYDGANDPKAEGIGDLDWYDGNIADASKPYYPVGAPKKPNAWGFYNMYGNCPEWMLDKITTEVDLVEVEPTGPIGGTTGGTCSRRYRGSLGGGGDGFFSAFCEGGNNADWQGIGIVRFCAPAIAK